jgi:hypothetical protein
MQGVKRTDGIGKKLRYEADYRKQLNANPALKGRYEGVLDSLNEYYRQIQPYAQTRDYYSELVKNVELFDASDKVISFLNEVHDNGTGQYAQLRDKFLNSIKSFYQNYNATVDHDISIELLALYNKGVPEAFRQGSYADWWKANNNDSRAIAKVLFTSDLTSYDKLSAVLQQPYANALEQLKKDPAIQYSLALRSSFVDEVTRPLNTLQAKVNSLQRTYMQAQMDVLGAQKRFYPDANSTLRITYGKVNGYSPRDAVEYDYYTYLDGVMEKYIPGDYEFDVPAKLIELYKKKDYGRYGVNGKMPVCFIASNHTTGGNSGSPALNAYGQLVGLNFDRTWEGTMSDINFDPSICRNIMVDIRYVLFIIDKYAGCTRLVDEMKLR